MNDSGTQSAPDNSRISVVIADDHPIVRAGLRLMIDKAADIRILGEAGDGEEALEMIEAQRPDVALLDIEMPKNTGLDVLRDLQCRAIRTSAIMLTLHDDRDIFHRAIELGAMGYILKDSAPQDIVTGIRRVAGGDHYVGGLPGTNGRRVNPRSGELLAVESLTPAERRVLGLIAENRSTREIAEALFVSPRTIDTHRASVCSKLGVSGSFALIRFAIEHRMFL
ncbi:MAG: response regulator transcription factor [Bacteroidetes bacterium]|nr:response regulator transcription factor [Bacteroidota bacterium]